MRGICLFMLIALVSGRSDAAYRVLATADTEGHLSPCRSCPVGVGLGGMARRAALLAKARAQDPELLLVDAGNFLFGPESNDSRGAVMVAAYNAIHYDAVNLSYRDFRLGKDRTLELLREAKFDVVSANLLDEKTGNPLFRPYIVRRVGSGRRVGFLGLNDPPMGWEQLPELVRQLAGVRVVSSETALAAWLPQVAAQCDQVILLYYGSAAGLARIRAQAGQQVCTVIAGGAMDVEDRSVAIPRPHGKSLVELSFTDGSAPSLKDRPVTPDVTADGAMQHLLASFEPKSAGSSSRKID